MFKYLVAVVLGFTSMSAFADVCVEHGAYAESTGTVKGEPLCYEKVKNGSGATLAAGAVVIWDTTADDGVTVTTSASRNAFPACVLMEAVASGAIGKCQTYGRHVAGVLFDSFGGVAKHATAGNALYISTTRAGYAQGLHPTDDHVGLIYPLGVWLDSATATASVEAFIKLR